MYFLLPFCVVVVVVVESVVELIYIWKQEEKNIVVFVT